MTVLPGLLLALVLAFAGQFLSEFIGKDLMGLPKSPISAIMMAIIAGIAPLDSAARGAGSSLAKLLHLSVQ